MRTLALELAQYMIRVTSPHPATVNTNMIQNPLDLTGSTWRKPLMADSPAQLAKVFRAANTVIRPLLRSPLHGLVSGRLMLLDYAGGKTGRHYSFPVGYFGWNGGDVLAFSTQRWPARIRGARAVRVLIRGRWHDARPTVISGQQDKVALLAEIARRKGARAAKGLMLGLPGDRQPTREEMLAAAAKTTITRFTFSSWDSAGAPPVVSSSRPPRLRKTSRVASSRRSTWTATAWRSSPS